VTGSCSGQQSITTTVSVKTGTADEHRASKVTAGGLRRPAASKNNHQLSLTNPRDALHHGERAANK